MLSYSSFGTQDLSLKCDSDRALFIIFVRPFLMSTNHFRTYWPFTYWPFHFPSIGRLLWFNHFYELWFFSFRNSCQKWLNTLLGIQSSENKRFQTTSEKINRLRKGFISSYKLQSLEVIRGHKLWLIRGHWGSFDKPATSYNTIVQLAMLGATFELLGNLHGDWTYEDCLRPDFKIIFDKIFFRW